MATMTRVLPWRRQSSPVDETATLVDTYRAHHPKAPVEDIVKAYRMAAAAHAGQRRKSGEPYVNHPLSVATIVAGIGLDDVCVIGALLHDVVEDTDVTLDEIEQEFGPEIARVVDGVTKLDGVKFNSKEHAQAATMRKMMVAIAQDLRVLIIKLCDRLHNLQTIAVLPPEKQERIAAESLDVYAPLAHRLGMQEVKTQIEELAFAALHPKRYAEIDQMVTTRAPERDLYLTQVLADLEHRLSELSIKADVTGRPKNLWSIYEKMVVKGRSFDEIYDLVGVRVVVESVRDCYAALGSIHSTWRPVQGRFKDYIAMPKFNLYQSLHTTVVGPQGKPLEVQIRTREMHDRAENGIAAHWDYKDANATTDLAWLNRIVEWQEETTDPGQFMANLKIDLEQDEVFVFTPKGKVITLSVGATPVDFAYSIHTEVGHACIGARVNNRLVPLDSRLESGDVVQIITSKVEGAGPSRDWLKFVATHRAANKIKQWYSRERRVDAIESGREELTKALRREGLPVSQVLGGSMLVSVAESLNYGDLDSLYAAVGEGHVSGKAVAARIGKSMSGDEPEREERVPTTATRRRRHRRNASGTGVHVEGLDDVLIRLSRCCTPVPPDEIIGFVTRGRGVSVHRADCTNAESLAMGQPDRLIDVEWDEEPDAAFVTSIEVKALDRTSLVRDVATVLADHQLNIVSVNTTTGSDRIATMRFEIELADAAHLDAVLGTLRGVESVYDAYRVLPGHGG